MIVSLNEIQNLIYRSGLAINLPVGIAKENSFVARSMLIEKFISLNVFVKAFDSFREKLSVSFDIDQASEGKFVPEINKKKLSSLFVSSTVCDLLSLSDKKNKEKIIVNKIDEPTILLFHILKLSRKLNRDFKVSFILGNIDSIFLVCTYNGIFYLEKNDLFEDIKSDQIIIENFRDRNSLSDYKLMNKKNSEFFIEDEVWLYFSKYSNSLLVADSDKSRINNAGNGLNDND